MMDGGHFVGEEGRIADSETGDDRTTLVADATAAIDDDSLRQLIIEWTDAELISPDQATAIARHVHDHHGKDRQSRGYRRMVAVASTLGAVLVGAGVLLVVGSNWGSFTPLAKTSMAIALVAVLEAVGYWVRYRTPFVRTGEAIVFVGTVAYGGAIFLAAQVYNRPIDDPNLFVFWLVPVAPIAYVIRSRAIMALSLLVTLGVIGYRLDDWADHALPMAGLMAYVLIGAAFASVGGVQRDIRGLRYAAPPWEWIGTVAIVIVVFISGLSWVQDVNGRWLSDVGGPLLVIAGGATACAFACIVVRAGLRRTIDREVGFTAALVGIAGVTAAVLITAPFTGSTEVVVVMGVVMLALVATLTFGGIATDRPSLVNVAFVAFAVWVFAHYLEIGAGMLGTGVAMIVGGILLISMGVGLEQIRRRIMASMAHSEVDG